MLYISNKIIIIERLFKSERRLNMVKSRNSNKNGPDLNSLPNNKHNF
jgi:hypothetical protein